MRDWISDQAGQQRLSGVGGSRHDMVLCIYLVRFLLCRAKTAHSDTSYAIARAGRSPSGYRGLRLPLRAVEILLLELQELFVRGCEIVRARLLARGHKIEIVCRGIRLSCGAQRIQARVTDRAGRQAAVGTRIICIALGVCAGVVDLDRKSVV